MSLSNVQEKALDARIVRFRGVPERCVFCLGSALRFGQSSVHLNQITRDIRNTERDLNIWVAGTSRHNPSSLCFRLSAVSAERGNTDVCFPFLSI